MEWLMEKLGHPERRIHGIHIGGTNGKGSTVTYLRSILQEAGYQVGSFTSPYFERFNERISLNGTPISDEEIVELANVIYPLANELETTELGGPTEFEIITAMSFYYFGCKHPVDIALFEVGLGGRLDSTNIIHPMLSIITSIGLDHTAILGPTYADISFEKAGIIKNGVSTITAVKQPEAIDVIRNTAAEKKSRIYELDKDFFIKNDYSTETGECFSFHNWFNSLEHIEIKMMGKHQIENASLAIMASQLLSKNYSYIIDEIDIKAGLNKAYWPGRFDVVSKEPLVIVDGAHNEEGIDALVTELQKRYSHKKINIIFAALSDKKLDHMIEKLETVAEKMTFVSFDFPRAADANTLYQLSKLDNKRMENDWRIAVKEVISSLPSTEALVITGSLYFLSEVRPYAAKIVNINRL
jgi:dihydrofolate synthase/folylpolyglutamate synthase